ncbi:MULTISPECIES: hypothetical protein [unclassified Mycobacterium]|uniref:hypothetical protein n=1 Tax=unclassified Mycobacterium TaxID=2642494 RepID=UPI0009932951|nr:MULTISPECIES: hypothetical protein [unclassified Mycobacterium]
MSKTSTAMRNSARKLNGIADGFADIADALARLNPELASNLGRDRVDLLDAVGLEAHESTESG